MDIIIFNKSDESFHMACSDLPNQGYLDTSKWIVTKLPAGEICDPAYKYTPVDGVAVKGSLITVDEAAVNAMLADVAAEEYKVKRRDEYPSIEDQLDKIYHEGIDAWKATIKVTKDKYPKG